MKKRLFAVLMMSALAFAADQAPNKTPRANEFPFTFGPIGISALMKTAGISEGQVKQIQSVIESSHDALKQQLEDVDAKEGALQTLLAQPQVDPAAAERLVDAILEARGRLSKTQTMMMVSLRGLITQDQWNKMADKTNTQARINLNETSASNSIRTVNTCVVTFFSTYKKGYPDGLHRLATPPAGQPMDENHADVCGPKLSGNEADGTNLTFTGFGYKFTYTPGPGGYGNIKSYGVTAQPVEFGVTGSRSFFTDETGVVRATYRNRPATAADPVN